MKTTFAEILKQQQEIKDNKNVEQKQASPVDIKQEVRGNQEES